MKMCLTRDRARFNSVHRPLITQSHRHATRVVDGACAYKPILPLTLPPVPPDNPLPQNIPQSTLLSPTQQIGTSSTDYQRDTPSKQKPPIQIDLKQHSTRRYIPQMQISSRKYLLANNRTERTDLAARPAFPTDSPSKQLIISSTHGCAHEQPQHVWA